MIVKYNLKNFLKSNNVRIFTITTKRDFVNVKIDGIGKEGKVKCTTESSINYSGSRLMCDH